MVDRISKGALSLTFYPPLGACKTSTYFLKNWNHMAFKILCQQREVYVKMLQSSSEFEVIRKICRNLESFNLIRSRLDGPRQANLVLIAYASSEGSGEPAHPRSLARTFAARSYKQ